jgi:glycosyltransferase involved in cell wall biosynthesis
MISVAALTLGTHTPSARFRVRQFVPALATLGVAVTEHHPKAVSQGTLSASSLPRAAQISARLASSALRRLPEAVASWRADITWLSKQVVVGVPSLEGLLHRPLVLDVDDAMWLARPLGSAAARLAAKRADAVVVGNGFLAAWYGQHNANVHVVPTSIDTARFIPGDHQPDAPFVIGWTGSAATLPYLEGIERGLDAFFESNPDARLLVICDEPPHFSGRSRQHTELLPWSEHSEVAGLSRMSVGIMPLLDDDMARGKCSFKMLQYMASAIPVVVSPVGSNAEILAKAEIGWAASSVDAWVHALEACMRDRERARRLGLAGRELVEREFSVDVSSHKLAQVFRAVHARGA